MYELYVDGALFGSFLTLPALERAILQRIDEGEIPLPSSGLHYEFKFIEKAV